MNKLTFEKHEDEVFAVLLSVLGLGMWVFLVYELATHLMPPLQ